MFAIYICIYVYIYVLRAMPYYAVKNDQSPLVPSSRAKSFGFQALNLPVNPPHGGWPSDEFTVTGKNTILKFQSSCLSSMSVGHGSHSYIKYINININIYILIRTESGAFTCGHFCHKGHVQNLMLVPNYFFRTLYLPKSSTTWQICPRCNLSTVLLGMGRLYKGQPNWVVLMLDLGGICISCFQVQSIIETGFWMVLVEHCVWSSDPSTIRCRGFKMF
jgi:hypothetical protein